MQTRPTKELLGLALISLWLIGVEASAQPLVEFVSSRASLGGVIDSNWRNSSGFLSRPYNQSNFRQWAVIPFQGSLLDAGFFNYSFTLKPNFAQQNATDLPESIRSRNLGYMADAVLLSAKPVSLNIHWSRDTGLQSGGFGTQGENSTEVFNPGLFINTAYLPIHISFNKRISKSLIQVGPGLIPIERSDGLRAFKVEARNSKLTAGFENTRFEDFLRENDYSSRNYYLDHHYRWGKKSELSSSYNFVERSGTLPYKRWNWRESVRLQHTMRTYTHITFSRFSSEGLGGQTRGGVFNVSINSALGSTIDYGVNASNSSSSFASGKLQAFSVGPSIGYSKKISDNLGLSLNGSGQYVKRRLENGSSVIVQIINESIQVDNTRIVALEEPNISAQSILVQNAEQTLFLVEGLDYEVISVGQLVEIHILPGSRIVEGDRILVSYQYRPQFDATDEGVSGAFSAGLRVAGINIRHAQSLRSTNVMGEKLRPVSADFNQQTTTISTFRKTPIGYLDVRLINRSRKSETLRYTTNEASTSLNLPAWRVLRSHFTALFRTVDEGDDIVRLYSAGIALSVNLESKVRIHAGINYQNWEQVKKLTEQTYSINASFDYQIGLVGLKLRYDYDRRSMKFRSVGHRISMNILRRF